MYYVIIFNLISTQLDNFLHLIRIVIPLAFNWVWVYSLVIGFSLTINSLFLLLLPSGFFSFLLSFFPPFLPPSCPPFFFYFFPFYTAKWGIFYILSLTVAVFKALPTELTILSIYLCIYSDWSVSLLAPCHSFFFTQCACLDCLLCSLVLITQI